MSIQKVSQQYDINKNTFQRTLKRNNYHPFKIRLIQELLENSYDKRMEFCAEMVK